MGFFTGAGGSIIGGGIAGIGGLLTNASNKREAERNRNWQEYMSNTAHQRAKRDLEKAGLNPLLAAQDAASTPGGAQATLSNAAEGTLSSAMEARRLGKDLELADEQINVAKSQTALNTENANLAKETATGQSLSNILSNLELGVTKSRNPHDKNMAPLLPYIETIGKALGGASSAKDLLKFNRGPALPGKPKNKQSPHF